MVTIAVLAIIVTIAAPNMTSVIEKRKIESLATNFEHLIIKARSEAVLNRSAVTVHLNVSGVDTPKDHYWTVPEGVAMVFSSGVCNSKWSKSEIAAVSTMIFLPQGNISNLATNLEIQLKSDSTERFIYLTNFGRISTSTTSAFVGDCA